MTSPSALVVGPGSLARVSQGESDPSLCADSGNSEQTPAGAMPLPSPWRPCPSALETLPNVPSSFSPQSPASGKQSPTKNGSPSKCPRFLKVKNWETDVVLTDTLHLKSTLVSISGGCRLGFTNLSTLHVWGWIILWGGDYPVYPPRGQ